jgi:hypothetical protein
MDARTSIIALAAAAAAVAGLWAPAVLAGDSRGGVADEVVKSVASMAYPLDVAGARMLLPFVSNHPLERAAPFKELVVMVHGAHRQVNDAIS